jgi:HPt (histidine-containing phosphotransfer) domain-containing protein
MSSIDPTALIPYREAMGSGADSFVIDLIETFLGSTQELVDALDTSVLSGDAKVFTRAAHTLKSNSAIFGANLLSNLSFELELAGKNTDLATLLPKIEQLKTEYQQVCRELVKLRQSITG